MSAEGTATVVSDLMQRVPGLVVCAFIALVCISTCTWVIGVGPSAAPAAALLMGIVLRIAVRIALPTFEARLTPGAGLARKQLLKAAVVLVGLQVTSRDIVAAGWSVILVDVLMVATTLAVAWWLGRILQMERSLTLLIGVGAAICGTSAVMAAQQTTSADENDAAVAVGTVVAGGLACLALYPALWALNAHMQLFDAVGFGRYVGSTVHEVAQVLAVTSNLDRPVGEAALVAKMGRVALLAPVLLLIALASKFAGKSAVAVGQPRWTPEALRTLRSAVGFPLLFAAAVLLSWAVPVPEAAKLELTALTLISLSAALAGAGLNTSLATVKQAGFRPLLLGLGLLVWLVLGGALINAYLLRASVT